MKRGLVLAGGGARGAFQIGVLKVLHARGIQFEAVSGTSVGALNAALWACGALDKGEAFWRSITYDAVYPPRNDALRRLPPNVYYNFLKAQMLANVLWGVLTRKPLVPELERFRVTLAWVNATIVSALLTTALVISQQTFTTESDQVIVLASLVTWAGFAVFLVGMQRNSIDSGISNHYLVRLSLVSLVMAPVAAFAGEFLPLILSTGVVVLLVAAFRTTQVMFLTSGPLATAIDQMIGGVTPSIPTFVTAARQVELFDPLTSDFKRMMPNLGPAGTDFSQAEVRHAPQTQNRWIPEYFDLRHFASNAQISEPLLASAALPFGVVEPIRIGEKLFVDGGVCDNVPIAPLLDLHLDEIFVVTLTPGQTKSDLVTSLRTVVAENRRNQALAQLGVPDDLKCRTHELYEAVARSGVLEKFHRIGKPASLKPLLPRVVHIRPDEVTGGFFDGVLRFEATYCSSLIEDGERCARATLDAAIGTHQPTLRPGFH